MKYLKHFMAVIVIACLLCFYSCTEKKTGTVEETEIKTMDSTSKKVKEASDKLDEQTKKVEESLEKLDEEFKDSK